MASKKQNKNTITILLIIAVLFFLTKGNIPFLGSAEPLPCGGNTNLTCPSGYSCTPSINSSELVGTCEPTGIIDCVSSGGSWIAPKVIDGINQTDRFLEAYCDCPSGTQLINQSCEKIPASTLCTRSGGFWEVPVTNSTPSCTCPTEGGGFNERLGGCESPITCGALSYMVVDGVCQERAICSANGIDSFWSLEECEASLQEQQVIYYHFENNACSQQLLAPSSATANDYSSLAECENKITTPPPSNGGGSAQTPPPPQAKTGSGLSTTLLLGVLALVAFIIIKKKVWKNVTKK